MPGEIQVRRIQFRLVQVRVLHARLEVVGNDDLRAATEVGEGANVRTDQSESPCDQVASQYAKLLAPKIATNTWAS
jgi:hypothetical protein